MGKGILLGALFLIAGAGSFAADDLSDIFSGAPSDGVVSMESILADARTHATGAITEIELERKRGAWVYEVDYVAQDGRKWELLYDARTGRLLSHKRD